MFTLSRRHKNRARNHELAESEQVVVSAHKANRYVSVDIDATEDVYTLQMNPDQAYALAHTILRAIDDSGKVESGWVFLTVA